MVIICENFEISLPIFCGACCLGSCAIGKCCCINSMLSCFAQITSWLQCLFIFAMVWSIGGTINGDSRKKFDAFFRLLISGTDKDHPKPNNIKMTKVNNYFIFD